MDFYLDSADYGKISEMVEAYNLKGVTCNPTIIIKDKADIHELVKVAPKDRELFVQVIADDEEGMIEDAKKLMALGDNVIVKIPATPAGLRAIRRLSKEGIKTLATAIYSVQQALMAANCGAAYVAPYVNRMCNNEMDGIGATLEICKIFKAQNIDCIVIAASFKNVYQVRQLVAGGVEAVTVGADIMEKMICNEDAIAATNDFVDGWEAYTGKRELGL